nr:type II toxin-antitoxin system antitoxin SocA domain-containing protein [Paenibacillus oenotherae]
MSALEVSRWFVLRNNMNTQQYGDELLSHLKLQKLLYYAQGIFLAYTNGKSLFNEEIHAWDHGPVVPGVYTEYKEHGRDEIEFNPEHTDMELLDKVSGNEEIKMVLEFVYTNYGKYSAWHLRNKTHEERPWKVTPRNKIIKKEVIQDYFMKEVLVD